MGLTVPKKLMDADQIVHRQNRLKYNRTTKEMHLWAACGKSLDDAKPQDEDTPVSCLGCLACLA